EIDRASEECVRRFSARGADLVVVALPLAEGNGGDLLRRLHDVDARIKIVVTGRDDEIEGAADAFRLGAYEYVEEASGEMSDLLAAVGTALGSRRGDVELRWLKERDAAGASW